MSGTEPDRCPASPGATDGPATTPCPICAAPQLLPSQVLTPSRLVEIHALETHRPGLRHELLTVFGTSARESLDRCRQALAVDHHEELVQASHRLLGSASSLGAERLASLAARTEAAADGRASAQVLSSLIAQLEASVEEVLAAYRQWLDV